MKWLAMHFCGLSTLENINYPDMKEQNRQSNSFPLNLKMFDFVLGRQHLVDLLSQQANQLNFIGRLFEVSQYPYSLKAICTVKRCDAHLTFKRASFSGSIYSLQSQVRKKRQQQCYILNQYKVVHNHLLVRGNKQSQGVIDDIRSMIEKGMLLKNVAKATCQKYQMTYQTFTSFWNTLKSREFRQVYKQLGSRGYHLSKLRHTRIRTDLQENTITILSIQQDETQRKTVDLEGQNEQIHNKRQFQDPGLPSVFLMASQKMVKQCKDYGDKIGFYIHKNAVEEESVQIGQQRLYWHLGIFIGADVSEKAVPLGLVIFPNDSVQTFACVFLSFFRMVKINPDVVVTKYESNLVKSLDMIKNLGSWTGHHFIDSKNMMKRIRGALYKCRSQQQGANQDTKPKESHKNLLADFGFFETLDKDEVSFESFFATDEIASIQNVLLLYSKALTTANQQQFMETIYKISEAVTTLKEYQFLYGFLRNSYRFCRCQLGSFFQGFQLANAKQQIWLYGYKRIMMSKSLNKSQRHDYTKFIKKVVGLFDTYVQDYSSQIAKNKQFKFDEILSNYELGSLKNQLTHQHYLVLIQNYIDSLRLRTRHYQNQLLHRFYKSYQVIDKKNDGTQQVYFLVDESIFSTNNIPNPYGKPQKKDKSFSSQKEHALYACSCGERVKTGLPCQHQIKIIRTTRHNTLCQYIKKRWLIDEEKGMLNGDREVIEIAGDPLFQTEVKVIKQKILQQRQASTNKQPQQTKDRSIQQKSFHKDREGSLQNLERNLDLNQGSSSNNSSSASVRVVGHKVPAHKQTQTNQKHKSRAI